MLTEKDLLQNLFYIVLPQALIKADCGFTVSADRITVMMEYKAYEYEGYSWRHLYRMTKQQYEQSVITFLKSDFSSEHPQGTSDDWVIWLSRSIQEGTIIESLVEYIEDWASEYEKDSYLVRGPSGKELSGLTQLRRGVYVPSCEQGAKGVSQ